MPYRAVASGAGCRTCWDAAGTGATVAARVRQPDRDVAPPPDHARSPTTTSSPTVRPDTTCVSWSPTTPAWNGTLRCTPPGPTTVTVVCPPSRCTAEFGTA